MAVLESASTEVLVNAARPLRDDAGPNERAFVEQFNQMIESQPIPAA